MMFNFKIKKKSKENEKQPLSIHYSAWRQVNNFQCSMLKEKKSLTNMGCWKKKSYSLLCFITPPILWDFFQLWWKNKNTVWIFRVFFLQFNSFQLSFLLLDSLCYTILLCHILNNSFFFSSVFNGHSHGGLPTLLLGHRGRRDIKWWWRIFFMFCGYIMWFYGLTC